MDGARHGGLFFLIFEMKETAHFENDPLHRRVRKVFLCVLRVSAVMQIKPVGFYVESVNKAIRRAAMGRKLFFPSVPEKKPRERRATLAVFFSHGQAERLFLRSGLAGPLGLLTQGIDVGGQQMDFILAEEILVGRHYALAAFGDGFFNFIH